MAGTKHTAGPWAVNEERYSVESQHDHGWVNDGWVICVTEGPDRKANARLIAAAPDLLAALKQVEAEMRAGFGSSFGETREQVRRAIAKAEASHA